MRRWARRLLEAARRERIGFECFMGVHVRCGHEVRPLTWEPDRD